MDHEQRIAELEATLKQRDERIEELKDDLQSTRSSVSNANERVDNLLDHLNWATDAYAWRDEFWAEQNELRDKYNDLLKAWNKFFPKYNRVVAPKVRNFGRPLAASPSQCGDVLKRQKAGQPLRKIAEETGLGLQTVRTIIDKEDGTDRATLARIKRITPDKSADAKDRRDRATRAEFPRQIEKAIKEAKGILKEFKGLGKDR